MRILFAFSIVALLAACGGGGQTMSETTTTDTGYAYFGDSISVEAPMTIAEFQTAMAGNDTMDVKLAGHINAACQVKGCWMTIDMGEGQEEMRVKFKDYGFFVPVDCGGSEAVFEGTATVTETSVADLQHYAQDAGASEEEIAAITEPKQEITFLANGVAIKTN